MIHLSEGVKDDWQIDPILINRLNDVIGVAVFF